MSVTPAPHVALSGLCYRNIGLGLLALFGLLLGCGDDAIAPESSVTVTPANATAVVGDSVTFVAQAFDGGGAVLANKVFTWSSSDESVVVVGADGRGLVVGSGTATIQAEVDGMAGQATLTVAVSATLAGFAPLSVDTLTVIPLTSSAAVDAADLAGVDVELLELEDAISITFLTAARVVIGGPIVLTLDPGSRVGQVRMMAPDAALFGREGVTVTAWVSAASEGEYPLQINLDSRPLNAAAMSQGALQVSVPDPYQFPQDRWEFLERWDELQADENLTALDRWSTLVQEIVDLNLSQQTDKDEFIDAVTDDLVDLFIQDPDYRDWLIDGTSVLGASEFIADGIQTGFSPVFRNGEGRYRHFSANAAVNEEWYIPGFFVNLGARIAGGDFNPENDATGDIAADLASNEIGREFPGQLGHLWDRREAGETTDVINDGQSVRIWMRDKFGPGVETVEIGPDPIPELPIGTMTQLTATTFDSEGNFLSGYGVTWSSSNPDVVSVDENGQITRHQGGGATITATAEGTGATGTKRATVPGILVVTGADAIDFTHIMGVTECFQQIAVLTVTNTVQESVQWVASEIDWGGPIRIEGDPHSGTLQPGESVQVTVSYRCNRFESFTTEFEITGSTGPQGIQSSERIPVNATIDASEGSLTVTTSTQGGTSPEGYRLQDVAFGTDLGTIMPNETKTFTGVRPGRYEVRLIPLTSDSGCTVGGGSVQDVVVPAGGTATLDYSVSCLPPQEIPSNLTLSGTFNSQVGGCSWNSTISNPGPITLVTEVAGGMTFLTIESDADVRGEYNLETGAWTATGLKVYPGSGSLRESIDGTWQTASDGTVVFRGTLTFEFFNEDGSPQCSAVYDVEYGEF